MDAFLTLFCLVLLCLIILEYFSIETLEGTIEFLKMEHMCVCVYIHI